MRHGWLPYVFPRVLNAPLGDFFLESSSQTKLPPPPDQPSRCDPAWATRRVFLVLNKFHAAIYLGEECKWDIIAFSARSLFRRHPKHGNAALSSSSLCNSGSPSQHFVKSVRAHTDHHRMAMKSPPPKPAPKPTHGGDPKSNHIHRLQKTPRSMRRRNAASPNPP